MTGWRCGWIVAQPALAAACNAVQSHSTSHATSITQRAAEAALRGPQDCLEAMRAEYQARRDALAAWMADDGRRMGLSFRAWSFTVRSFHISTHP